MNQEKEQKTSIWKWLIRFILLGYFVMVALPRLNVLLNTKFKANPKPTTIAHGEVTDGHCFIDHNLLEVPDLEYGSYLTIDHDGNLVVAGRFRDNKVGLLKVDQELNKLWFKRFTAEKLSMELDLITTSNGDYLINGSNKKREKDDFDWCVLRLDKDGKKIWEKNIGGEYMEMGGHTLETKDHGFIISGHERKDKKIKSYVLKLTTSGEIEWSHKGIDRWQNFKYSSIQLPDNSLVFMDRTEHNERISYDLTKLTKEGKELWKKQIASIPRGSLFLRWIGPKLTKSNDGNLIVVFNYGSIYNQIDVSKYSTKGELIWEKSIENLYDAMVYKMLVAEDGHVFLFGNVQQPTKRKEDIMVVKISPQGQELWTKTYGSNLADYSSDAEIYDGKIFILGYSKEGGQLYHSMILKIDQEGQLIE